MMGIKEKATRGVAWTALGNWGNQIATVVVFVVLTRLLAPEAFGLVAMATVFTSFVSTFAEQGLGQAIVQRDKLEPEHLDAAFWANMTVGTTLTLAGIFLSPVIASLYGEPKLQPVVAALSATFLLTALSSNQQALLQRNLNFRVLSLRQLVAAVVGGLVAIALAFAGAGVYALVAKTLVTGLVGAIILWRVNRWRPHLRFSVPHFRDLFGFGASMVGVKMTNFFSTRLDDFLIGYFLGATALGYYTVAYRLGRLTLDMFTGVMSSVAVTTFARLQNERARLRAVLLKVTVFTALITFPIFTALIVLAPDLIVALSGAQWLRSAPVMRILSIAGFTLSLQYFLSFLIISLGKPDRLFLLNGIVTAVAALGFVISARFGIIYVAVAYVVVNVSFFGVYLAVAHRLLSFDIRRYLLDATRAFIASLILGISLFLFNSYLTTISANLYIRLILLIILGVSLYAVSVYFLQRAAFVELWGLAISLITSRKSTPTPLNLSTNDPN